MSEENAPPLLGSIDALFIAIAPMSLPVGDWATWRDRYLDRTPGEGTPLGNDVTLATLTDLGQTPMAWTDAVETVFARARRFPGALIRASALEAALQATLHARLTALGAKHSSALWILASASIGPCLLVGCAFEEITAGTEPLQPGVVSAIRGSLDTLEGPAFAAACRLDAPLWLAAFGDLVTTADRTHLIGMYRSEGNEGTRTSSERFLACHLAEEADADDCATDYRYGDSTLTYAHVGYSYTTFAAAKLGDLVFLIPSTAMAQLSWAIQREFEGWLRSRRWKSRAPDNKDAAEQLSSFERIKLELRLFDLDRLAFLEGLRPWQQRFFNRYIDYWHIAESSRLLEDTSERISSFLDAGVKSRVLAANDRQSLVLFVIAALGVLGLAGTVAAYNDLLTGVGVVDKVHQASGYAVGIAMFFVLTLALTMLGGVRPSRASLTAT